MNDNIIFLKIPTIVVIPKEVNLLYLWLNAPFLGKTSGYWVWYYFPLCVTHPLYIYIYIHLTIDYNWRNDKFMVMG